MRAKSALSAFIAGLAFVGAITFADPASADHVPTWLYPYTRASHYGEVLCGSVGAIHGVDTSGRGFLYVQSSTTRTATNCAGATRSGPGELRVKMAAYQTRGGYTAECFPPTTISSWDNWIIAPARNVTDWCTPGLGYPLTVYASYGGWLFDQWYTAEHIPQTWQFPV